MRVSPLGRRKRPCLQVVLGPFLLSSLQEQVPKEIKQNLSIWGIYDYNTKEILVSDLKYDQNLRTYSGKDKSPFMIINTGHQRYSEEFMLLEQLRYRFGQEVPINTYKKSQIWILERIKCIEKMIWKKDSTTIERFYCFHQHLTFPNVNMVSIPRFLMHLAIFSELSRLQPDAFAAAWGKMHFSLLLTTHHVINWYFC